MIYWENFRYWENFITRRQKHAFFSRWCWLWRRAWRDNARVHVSKACPRSCQKHTSKVNTCKRRIRMLGQAGNAAFWLWARSLGITGIRETAQPILTLRAWLLHLTSLQSTIVIFSVLINDDCDELSAACKLFADDVETYKPHARPTIYRRRDHSSFSACTRSSN